MKSILLLPKLCNVKNDASMNNNGSLSHPIKHWRKQYTSTPTTVATNSRNASISSLIDTPGSYIYTNANSNCGNYSVADPKLIINYPHNNLNININNACLQNNGSVRVGNDYEILTGVYNTKRISCQNKHVIKSASTVISRAYYPSSHNYLKSRCKTFEQNNSVNPTAGVNYNASNRYNNDALTGSQMYQSNTICNPRISTHRKGGAVVYKPNNIKYSVQGAVDSGTRLENLKLNTIRVNDTSIVQEFGSGSHMTKKKYQAMH